MVRPSSYAWPNKLSRIGDCGATGRRSARLARRFSTTSPILSVSSPSAKSNRQAKQRTRAAAEAGHRGPAQRSHPSAPRPLKSKVGFHYLRDFLDGAAGHARKGSNLVAGLATIGRRPSGKFPGGRLGALDRFYSAPDGVDLGRQEVLADRVLGKLAQDNLIQVDHANRHLGPPERLASGEAPTASDKLAARRHVHAKGLRSADAIEAVFKNHIRPVLGTWSVYDVGLEDVNRLLDRVEDEAGAGAAQNVLQYLRQAMAFWQLRDPKFRSPIPAVRGLARIRKSERARTRILDDVELQDLWQTLDGIGDAVMARFVKALLLTGRRRGELAAMQWSEVQGDAWIIPAERMKGKVEFVQPITSAFRDLMGEPSAGYVFSRDGRGGFAGFSRHKARLDRAIAVLREREGRPIPSPWVWHDLRRSARSLMSRAGVPADHAERALAHAIPGVRQIYDRYSFFPEKQRALESLAALIDRILDPPPADVFHMKR
jgi:integrase